MSENPLDLKPCPFCKATLERWGGYYACPNKACSFPLGIAPVEPVPAPVGLDLEAALETERQRAEDDLEGARATGLSNAEQVSRARMMAYAHALTLARRASLSPRPATGASTSGRRETGPEIAKRLGIKVKDQQDQIDIESGKRMGEEPATGADQGGATA